MTALILIVGLVVGALVGWFAATSRLLRQLQSEREQMQLDRAQFQAEREARVAAETRLDEITKQLDSQRALVDEATAKLGDTFKALSSDALRSNSQAFVDSAKQTLEPLRESLKRYEDYLHAIERQREQAYGSLDAQLKQLASSEQQLQRETTNLVNALRQPQVRGRWGELTLRRAVELAGMADHVDYDEQESTTTDTGRLRPDMVVKLPGGRQVLVDAKVSLDGYLRALECSDDDSRSTCLTQHCRQMREHIRALSARSYWEQFTPTPEFVVMFVPGESFLQAACTEDNTLIEQAMQNGVVLASPTTLVALLRAVAYGWRHQQMEENAQKISELGQQLYDRVRVFAGHMSNVGKRLDSAAEAYNQAVGSLESRVLPTARRFQELGAASGAEIPDVLPVDTRARQLTAAEAEDQQ